MYQKPLIIERTKDYAKFDCGCTIKRELRTDYFGNINYYDLPLCDKVWELFDLGLTKGIFQLESYLGCHWGKELQVRSIQDLSDLISAIRPGMLDSKMADGKNMTWHFSERKNKREYVTYMDDCLEPILKPTQGIIVYQEQILKIARDIAGFSLLEANSLRKSIGKKLVSEMAKTESLFIDGCKRTGKISEGNAKLLFENIRASQRYLFVKAHAVGYALLSYSTAWTKAHFPDLFITANLRDAENRIEPTKEMSEIIKEMQSFGLEIQGPRLTDSADEFSLKGSRITFGLANIKGLGIAKSQRIREKIGEGRNWFNILIDGLAEVDSVTSERLCLSGYFSELGISRQRAHFEYLTVRKLSPFELTWIKSNRTRLNDLRGTLSLMVTLYPSEKTVARKDRLIVLQDLLKSLNNPQHSLDDTPVSIHRDEVKYLGVGVTYSSLGSRGALGNTTAKEFNDGKSGKLTIAAEIKRVKEIKTKKGDLMAFLSCQDETAELKSTIVFPGEYEKYAGFLFEGNTVLIGGERSSNGKDLIVKKVTQV